MIDRRRFLASTLTGGAVAAIGLKHDLFAQLEQAPPLPDPAKFSNNDAAYWAELRKQFLIPADEVYLNNGTVGSSPAPVLRAVFDGYYASEKLNESDPEDYPIWGYASWNQFRDPLAEFVGCKRDEIALLRNATEANSYIANGIDMKPGDEVLMTDQEHPGGESPWQLKAKRYGIVVKKVTLPKPVENRRASLEPFPRRHHSPHSRPLLQPHFDRHRRRSPCQRISRARPVERNPVCRRRRARSRHDETQHHRPRLRHVFLQSSQMASGTEGLRVSLRAR